MILPLPQRIADLEIERNAHGVVITDHKNDYVHILSDRAVSILEECDGTHTCDQIAQIVSEKTHVPYDRVAGEVAHIVALFADLALIESAIR